MFSPLPTTAQVHVVITTNTSKTVDEGYSFITIINESTVDGSIDFGNGNVAPLKGGPGGVGESLTLPYLGKPYLTTIIIAPAGCTIKTIYVI
jgi:hypothetical protein